MTLEELQAANEELQNQNKTLAEKNALLEDNQKNQNSYITKLEAKIKAPEQTILPASLADKQLAEYLQRNMRRDTIDEALQIISQNVDEKVVECLKPELMATLNKLMTIDKTKPSFVIDAFNLLYGQAMTNKDHPIHKLGQATQETPPAAPVSPAQQPQAKPVTAADISAQLRNFIPSMTPGDVNAAQTPPVQSTQINNTKDALNAFKNKVKEQGASKFS